MSTVAVLTKKSLNPEALTRKALDSMRVPQDREAKIIADENMSLGFVGSITSIGKKLVSAKHEDSSGINLIATSEFLSESIFNARGRKNRRVPEMPSILDILFEHAIHQKGSWSLVGVREGKLLGGRDIIGQSPLFWGRSKEYSALASSRKALWSIGIFSVNNFPQGSIIEFEQRRRRERRIGELTDLRSESMYIDETETELLELLRISIKTVVQYSKKVGILFSGGLDSSIVAAFSSGLGLDTRLYTAAFEDSSDIVSAERAAELLGLKLEVDVVSLDEAEDVLRKVVWETESSDPVQVCVGMPIEVATRLAVRRGERLLFSGSGADELFGGYSKYLETYRTYGEEGTANAMFRDIQRLGRSDLLRDGAIGEANRIQLYAPYLDLDLVRFGLSIPVCLKLTGVDDSLRKRVLRQTARMIEIPQKIIELPKKAAQYSSRSLRVARKLARRRGLSLNDYLESIFNEVFKDYFKAS